MRKIPLYLPTILMSLVVSGQSDCSFDDWSVSFDSAGLSKCSNDNMYVTGFDRSGNTVDDGIYHLEGAQCCSAQPSYESSLPETVVVDWRFVLTDNDRWATCPDGYFLQGLFRSDSWPGYLQNIEQGLCAKPVGHPDNYGSCYDEDITLCFDDDGLCGCLEDYYITGIYRGSCNKLMCIETLKCCTMAE
ncbi:unnamed protein product [Lymnaea stagnalis]|uniref:Uncharacterized protein n=1 Tax=Lymnaea stagnalis TaxID=6523 RepID=A0AAV2HJL4_LYMST